MSPSARVIPVEGITELPDFAAELQEPEARDEQGDLLLLNVTTGLSVILICCAWILLALD